MSAVEYGLVLALLSLGLIGVFSATGVKLSDLLAELSGALS